MLSTTIVVYQQARKHSRTLVCSQQQQSWQKYPYYGDSISIMFGWLQYNNDDGNKKKMSIADAKITTSPYS